MKNDVISCPSCNLLMIQGMPCHEFGCPDKYLFSIRECNWCGMAFEPQDDLQYFCEASCSAAYHGVELDAIE